MIGKTIVAILGLLAAIGGFVISKWWFHVIVGWSGDMPYIISVMAWFFLGGIEIIIIGLIIGFAMILAAFSDEW